MQVILLTNMLEYLEIHNSFVSDVYMEDISNMLCQFYRLHLEQQFIQQQHYHTRRHLC